MHRRGFLLTSLADALAAPLAVEAQQRGRARIAILETSALDPARVAWWDAFRQRMGELGYVEGQNVTFETSFAEGRIERLATLAAQIVKMKVDVIVTGGTPAAQAAKRATTRIPIVMATGADQVGFGIVAGNPGADGGLTNDAYTTVGIANHLSRVDLVLVVAPRPLRFSLATLSCFVMPLRRYRLTSD